jgi:hypothetical protein
MVKLFYLLHNIHISQQPGAQAAAVAEAAELRADRDKKDAADETERAAKAKADWEAAKTERAAKGLSKVAASCGRGRGCQRDGRD